MMRREFLSKLGLGTAVCFGEMWMPKAFGQQGPGVADKIHLPSFLAPTDPSEQQPPNPETPDRRVGYAIVGLGRIALENMLPAFGEAKCSKPVALVSGHRDKALKIAKQYGIKTENIFDYDNFDNIKDHPEIQAVYIALPNNLHSEFTMRAARAGKHVLCEKPMAPTSKECQEMIRHCKSAGKKLMIAYRCQYEPHHRALIEMGRSKALGDIQAIITQNDIDLGGPSQWRLKKWAGPLADVGVYCLNAARYLTGEEPVEVQGWKTRLKDDSRFKEVESSNAFVLRFPSGILANCGSSFSSHRSQICRVNFARGWGHLDPAFPYENIHLKVAQKLDNAESITERELPRKNQFAHEADHFSECIVKNQASRTPGEEGLQDVRLMEAINDSVEAGHAIKLRSPGFESLKG